MTLPVILEQNHIAARQSTVISLREIRKCEHFRRERQATPLQRAVASGISVGEGLDPPKTKQEGSCKMYQSRKSPRLENFDYATDQYYFITICTWDKKCIFGQPNALNENGKIAMEELHNLQNHYQHIRIDSSIVMPNHIHAIIVIGCDNNEGQRPNLNTVVGQYKSGVSRRIHQRDSEIKVWHRSYHDHIIRNQASYEKIWNYIQYNANKWQEDCFYVPI